jgi:hypothetical protein
VKKQNELGFKAHFAVRVYPQLLPHLRHRLPHVFDRLLEYPAGLPQPQPDPPVEFLIFPEGTPRVADHLRHPAPRDEAVQQHLAHVLQLELLRLEVADQALNLAAVAAPPLVRLDTLPVAIERLNDERDGRKDGPGDLEAGHLAGLSARNEGLLDQAVRRGAISVSASIYPTSVRSDMSITPIL